MKIHRRGQQIIEYLLLFTVVILVFLGAARMMRGATERVLQSGLKELKEKVE